MITLTKNFQKIIETYVGNTDYGDVYIRAYAKYTSQDIDKNQTSVTVEERVYLSVGEFTSSSGTSCYVDIAGDISYGNPNGTYYAGETTIKSHTATITHDSNGSKEISIGIGFTSTPWGWGDKWAYDSVKLPTIPRASTISCTSPYIGDTGTVIIDRKSKNFTSSVWFTFGSVTKTIVTKSSADSIPFKTQDYINELYAQIPNSRSGKGTMYCDTYSGNTKIGDTKSTEFSLYAKESDCNPSVSVTVADTNSTVTSITGSNQKFIKYLSKPKVTVQASAKNSASIKSYLINLNDGQTSNSSETTFSSIGSNTITVSAKDSREYSTSLSKTLDMVDYVKLHINSLSLARTEGTSTTVKLTCAGEWFNGSFTDTKANALTYQFQYRESGSSDWTNLTTPQPTINNNAFSWSNITLNFEFNYEKEYQFRVVVNDLLMSDNRTETIEKGQEIIAIGEDTVWVNGKLIAQNYEGNVNGRSNVTTHYNGYTTNLNSATTTGWYRFNKEATNRPDVIASWGVVVVQNDGNWFFQTAYGTFSVNGTRMAHRGYINGSWTDWEYIASGTGPVELYSNSTGTNGTVTLSKTAADYSYLEVFIKFMEGTGHIKSVKIPNPNGKAFQESFLLKESNNSASTVYFKNWAISGTSITTSTGGAWGSSGWVGDYNNIYIVKVLGYRV